MHAHPSPQISAQPVLAAVISGANGPTRWQMAKSSAMRLRLRAGGTLQVSAGRVWVTLDLHAHSRVQDAGDHFVLPGQGLHLRAGQAVVLESWPAKGADHTDLLWVPDAAVRWSSRWTVWVLHGLRAISQGLALAGLASNTAQPPRV